MAKMRAKDYQAKVRETDQIKWNTDTGYYVSVFGVIGEVGSLSGEFKKYERDSLSNDVFYASAIEELGDILWYVTTVATRINFEIRSWPAAKEIVEPPYALIISLQQEVTELVKLSPTIRAGQHHDSKLELVISNILQIMQKLATSLDSDLGCVADLNYKKILPLWKDAPNIPAKQFDLDFPSYEQIPRKFVIDFIGVEGGKSTLIKMNGINIGDRLTDNSVMEDGYRFHDVFHLVGAATLGWSPVFRRMLKLKRKSNAGVDEVQDGARAAIIEEAVINHVFDYARDFDFLEGKARVDFDLIRRIRKLVRGLEVEACEAWEWQDCILKGFKAYRALIGLKSARLTFDAERREVIVVPANC